MPSTDKARINSKGIDGSAHLTDDCVFQWVNNLAICIPHTKVVSLEHFMTMVYYITLGLSSSNVSIRTAFSIVHIEITVKCCS